MPYPKLAEGNRVFDAVFDAETNFADWNELQDQLKGMLGPLTHIIPMVGGIPQTSWGASSTTWDYYEEPGTDPPFWQTTGQASVATLNFPLPWLRAGMKITRLYAVTYGDSIAGDDGDGSVLLRSNTIAAAAAAVATEATVSAQPFRGSAWQLLDSGAIAVTVASTKEYRLRVSSAWDATARTCRILGAYATVQFGA